MQCGLVCMVLQFREAGKELRRKMYSAAMANIISSMLAA